MRTEYTVVLSVALSVMLAACDGNGGGGQGGSGAQGGGGSGTTSGGGGTGGDTSVGGAGGIGAQGGVGGGTGGTGAQGGAGGGTGGTGAGGGAAQAYPPPPYGYDVGSTIENYAFVGYPAPLSAPNDLGLVHLGDFYNPTGQGTYPAGSPYGAGAPMPKLLLIQVAAVWSGPDNYEADSVLPGVLASYGPCLGAQAVLIDGPTPGQAAEPMTAYNWAQKYDTPYPVCIDPAFQLEPIFLDAAFPTNILIDTVTMTIADVITGVPDPGGAFFQTNVVPVCP